MITKKEYYAVHTCEEKPLFINAIANGNVLVHTPDGKRLLLPLLPSQDKADERTIFKQIQSLSLQKKANCLMTVDHAQNQLMVSYTHPQTIHGKPVTQSFASSSAFMPGMVRLYDIHADKCTGKCPWTMSDDQTLLFLNGNVIHIASTSTQNDKFSLNVLAKSVLPATAGSTVLDVMFVPGSHDLAILYSNGPALNLLRLKSESKWEMRPDSLCTSASLSSVTDVHLLHVDPTTMVTLISQNNERVFQLSPGDSQPYLVARFAGPSASYLHGIRDHPGDEVSVYRRMESKDNKTWAFERIGLEASCAAYKPHPSKGAVSMSAVPEVEWLVKTPGHTGPHHYQLRFAMTRDVHVNSTWHTFYDNLEGKALEMRWPAGQQVPSNTKVTISLYKWRNNRYEQKCQYRVGDVRVSLSALTQKDCTTTFLFRDYTGDPQASLRFTNHQNTEAAAKTLSAATAQNDEVLEFPTHFDPEHVDGGIKPRGFVATVLRRMTVKYYEQQRVPVWMICMLRSEPACGEMYLAHVLNHVTRWLRYKDAMEWAQDEKGPNRFEVLSQVMSFYTAQEPYMFDKTFSISKQTMVSSDQFSISRDTPDAKTRSGDCEDFTADQISVFMAINGMQEQAFPSGSPLRKLVELAHSYCAFTADASIYNGEKELPETPHTDDPKCVDLHMFTVLIPWSKVRKLLQNAHEAKEPVIYDKIPSVGNGYPAMLLESTEPCVSDWSLPTYPMHLFTRDVTRAAHSLGPACKAVWDLVRYQTTRDTYVQDQFYRLCTCLYSQQMFDMTGYHSFLPLLRSKQNDERGYGVSVKWIPRFEEKDTRMGLKPLPAASADEVTLLKKLQNRMPWVAPIQFSSENTKASDNVYPGGPNFDVMRLFVREEDWKESHEQVIKNTLSQMNEFSKSHPNHLWGLSGTQIYHLWGSRQSLVVANGVRVVMYQVMFSKLV